MVDVNLTEALNLYLPDWITAVVQVFSKCLQRSKLFLTQVELCFGEKIEYTMMNIFIHISLH